MPFSGAGVYTPPAADFPVVTQTVISSTHFNNTINDIATALSTCLTKDGQQTATANIPFGGFRATNVGITAIAGSVGTPAINVSDAATGLYRSAASELAVTVAGTQVARFVSTGLIVTGAASVSTTLTATTSVVTPLVSAAAGLLLNAASGNTIQLTINSVGAWQGSLSEWTPQTDNSADLGRFNLRLAHVFTPILDSGTTGSLSLKTNNGTTQFVVAHTAGTVVNNWQATGNITTLAPQLLATGTDANVPAQIALKGTGTFSFITDALGTPRTQLQLLHGTGANNLTITNGANPTLGVTAGSLAITPAVVIAGASLQVGTTPAVTGHIGLPYSAQINTRNSANSADIVLLTSGTINSITDVVLCGGASGSSGVNLSARSAARAAVAADVQAGSWMLWRDTSGATTKLFYNNAGTLMSVALA